jgi:CheY-like chemotaxis protein
MPPLIQISACAIDTFTDPRGSHVEALRILLVEDEPLICIVAAEMLRDEGFDVEEASSGDAAALRLVGPEFFDVLFTDVQMPGQMDGIHVALHARTHHPPIILIIVSGFAPQVQDRLKGFDPAAMFFAKPYRSRDIVSSIRRLAA